MTSDVASHISLPTSLARNHAHKSTMNSPNEPRSGSQVFTAEQPVVQRAFGRIRELIRPSHDARTSSMKLLIEWLDKVVQYNVPHGKLLRLLQVIQTFESVSPGPVSEVDLENASVLGWVVEMFQAHYLILDDIMDKSITRRNRKCWYLLEEVGLKAINDAILLEAASLKVIRDVFRTHKSYLHIVELLHEVNYRTCQGQCLDLLSEKKGVYDEEHYKSIVELKTSCYTFTLPIRLGMYLADICDPEMHRAAEVIALQIGHIFQAQDDFLDCYGDQSGKLGTDITDGKCSWLLVRALQKASPQQKCDILRNVGRGERGGHEETTVKAIYNELQMKEEFKAFESRCFEGIRATIDQMKRRHGLEPRIFENLLTQLYRREK
ncbi:farnesyl pyrophosphate synthase-like [Galendromus occidentalis]|uniref:Farnesyl pyrophosphate synthase-like n=1 Tax=Galendromus occidentalis TaxID=34638 RepID=A0AAJ7L7Y7_9ACAR|nr:farnesyl pyrophosphate synthase-like [Galendromus occidentalis]